MVTVTKGLKFGKILLGSLAIAVVCYFLVQAVAKKQIQNLIQQKLPEEYSLDYEKVRLNLLTRSVALEKVTLKTDSVASTKSYFTLTLDALNAEKIDFITLIKNGNAELGILEVIGPNLNMVQQKSEKKNHSDKKKLPKIAIESLQITGARASYLNQTQNDTLFLLENGSISLRDIQFNDTTSEKFTSDTTYIQFYADNLEFRLNKYELLKIESTHLSEGEFLFRNLHLKTKYDWDTYSQKLRRERDHYDLTIKEMKGFGLRWPYRNEGTSVILDSLSISQLDCSIFRDKTLPDEISTKIYFTENLSKLDFPLHITKIKIANSKLSYFEKTEKSNSPQPLVFSSIRGDFANVSNQNDKALKIHLKSKLMENSPMELKLETHVEMPMKNFFCTGTLYDFNAGDINPFLSTNMGVKTKGEVEELYFTISGNRQHAVGDMKVKYDDFEFEVLKKDLLGVRKTTSFLLNLLVNKGNRTDENGYRYGEIEVEPEISKSFSNYLWVAVQDGLLDTVTGSGKKK